MTAHIVVTTIDLDVRNEEPTLDDLADAIGEAEAHAESLIEEEETAADPAAGDLPDCRFTAVGANGQPIAAIRLEREADTARFHLVLLTAEDL